MIDFGPSSDPVLARFVRDLDDEAPRAVRVAPDLAAHTPDDVHAARHAWAARIVDEQRSVAVFAELCALLASAEAPYAAIATVQRLVGDELRHARLCAAMTDALGGCEDLDIDLGDLGLPPLDEPIEARALRVVVRELVVAEAESVRVLRAYRDAATDHAARAALSLLLVDEVRHAAAGRSLAALLLATFRADRIAALREALPAIVEGDVGHLRATYRASATGGPGRALGASLRREDLDAAFGRA